MLRSLRRYLVATAAMCALASPALAQNITVKDGNGISASMCTKLFSGVNASCASLTSGVGGFTALPTPTTNGAALPTEPANAIGARLYCPSGGQVTFTVAVAAPGSAPAQTYTLVGGATGNVMDENLVGSSMIYVTAASPAPGSAGACFFRWW